MPAVSGSPTQIATSVATALDLSGTPDDAFTEGDLACVRSLWPQSTFRLRRTSLPYGIIPNNVTAIATYSGNGYWELFPQGGSLLSFPNIAALTSFDDQNLGDGAIVYVESIRSYWSKLIEPNPGTSDGITIVRNPSNTATWYRDSIPSPSWAQTSLWAVAATSGNDENIGTPSSPLKTFAEFDRRVQEIASHITVQILENTSEYFYGSFQGTTSSSRLSVQGIPTVIASSSVGTTFVDPITTQALTASMGKVTGTGLDFSTATGATGAFVRVGSHVAPVLGNTGPTGYVPFFADIDEDMTKPVDGSAIEVITLRSVPCIQINAANMKVDVSYIRMTVVDANYTNYVLASSEDKSVKYFACLNDGYIMSYGDARFIAHLVERSPGPYVIDRGTFIGGGSRRSGTIVWGITRGTYSFNGFIFNNATWQVGNVGSPASSPGAIDLLQPHGLGVFNAPASGILHQCPNVLIAGSPLYGRGNATYGLEVHYGALVQFTAGYTPAITGNTSDIRFNNATSAIPPLLPSSVVPASQSFAGNNGNGWNLWANNPFNRLLMSYSNGSKVCAG